MEHAVGGDLDRNLGSLLPAVSVMKATESGQVDDFGIRGWPYRTRTSVKSIERRKLRSIDRQRLLHQDEMRQDVG